MGRWNKLKASVFPKDFSDVNYRGDRCLTTARSYTIFRCVMLIIYAIDFSYYAWFY